MTGNRHSSRFGTYRPASLPATRTISTWPSLIAKVILNSTGHEVPETTCSMESHGKNTEIRAQCSCHSNAARLGWLLRQQTRLDNRVKKPVTASRTRQRARSHRSTECHGNDQKWNVTRSAVRFDEMVFAGEAALSGVAPHEHQRCSDRCHQGGIRRSATRKRQWTRL
jgi:hypothetical protein